MNNDLYNKAYVEVLEILSHFPEEYYKKIPDERIKFYEENKDKNYQFKIDTKIDLDKQNISKETRAILIDIYIDCFATEGQKIEIKRTLRCNQLKLEEEKRKKYDPDALFIKEVNTKTNKDTIETALVEYKESFFTRFKNFITRLLHINE